MSIIQCDKYLLQLCLLQMTVNEMDDGTCKNYNTDKGESYGQCMDTYLAGVYKPELGCVPPWMSHKDQCKGEFMS